MLRSRLHSSPPRVCRTSPLDECCEQAGEKRIASCASSTRPSDQASKAPSRPRVSATKPAPRSRRSSGSAGRLRASASPTKTVSLQLRETTAAAASRATSSGGNAHRSALTFQARCVPPNMSSSELVSRAGPTVTASHSASSARGATVSAPCDSEPAGWKKHIASPVASCTSQARADGPGPISTARRSTPASSSTDR